jgi:hypothetical protein
VPKFKVDVKAFNSITVDAENEDKARAAANLIAEFGPDFPLNGEAKFIDEGGWSVDGFSEVEKVCPCCEAHYLEEDEQICGECEAEA